MRPTTRPTRRGQAGTVRSRGAPARRRVAGLAVLVAGLATSCSVADAAGSPDEERPAAAQPHPTGDPANARPARGDGPRELTWRMGRDLVDPRTVSGTTTRARGGVVVRVQLPTSYDRRPRRTYPLLVLLHGAGGSAATWPEKGRLVGVGALDDVIVLSLEGGAFGMYTNWLDAGKARWMDLHAAIVDRAVRELRVAPGRRNHALAGVSMGGQGALRYAAAFPEFYGAAAAISPGLPNMRDPQIYAAYPLQIGLQAGEPVSYEDTWGPVDGSNAIGRNPQDLVANLANTRVFVSSGDGTPCPYESAQAAANPVKAATESSIAAQVPAYVRAARRAGVPVTVSRHCGVHGDWEVWRRDFATVLDSWDPFRRVAERPRRWAYRTPDAEGRAWGVDFRSVDQEPRLLTLERDGAVLTLRGSGRYDLEVGDCRRRVAAPSRQDLSGCW